ncbi:hypothetical protein QUF74_09635 [Candidatus Halobeggiatoa sp. HSG11]|nr:hypothetical protein [Candidatus Halobeggiatoa sp. HSG11]
MRSLALLLILANISLLLWQLKLLPWFPLLPEQFTPQVIKPGPTNISGLPSLILLNEQEVVAELDNTEELDDSNESSNVDEPNYVEIDKKDIIVTDIAKKVSEFLPELVTDNKVEDISTDKKVVVTATKSIKVENKPVELAPVSKPKQAEKIIYTCFKSGPYNKVDIAENIVNWLKEKDNSIVINLKKQTDKKLVNTWVYLPPFGSLEEAKRIREYLNKVGIKEHRLVKGKLKNAISLGVYGVPTNAAIRVKELKAKGYNNVKIRENFKESTSYWLNIKTLSSDLTDSFNNKFKDSTLITVACESIALQQFHKLSKTTLLNE